MGPESTSSICCAEPSPEQDLEAIRVLYRMSVEGWDGESESVLRGVLAIQRMLKRLQRSMLERSSPPCV